MAVAGVACLVAALALFLRDPRAGAEDIGALPAQVTTSESAAAGPAGAVLPGAVPPGAVPPGAVLPGAAPGAVLPGPVPPGAVPPAGPVAVVAGSVPVELSLPGRGVTAPVVPVGVDRTGGLVIPEPPSVVGWWAPSALAGGSAGRTVLAGHVDSAKAGLGALSVLREVGIGEPVTVRGADGRTVDYTVVARREYPKADLPADVFAPGGPPGLVLITCGGRFDRVAGHYEDNIVVHAVPVPQRRGNLVR